MKCTYEIIIDGQRKVFNSSMELDAFLASKFNDYFINETDASLHVDLVQEAKTKIDEIVTAVGNAQIAYTRENEDGESETILKIPKSIGTTKFPKTYGDPDHLSDVLITPFNEEEYFAKLKERLKSEGKSLEEINDILKKLEASWKVITDLGTDAHKIPEMKIKGTTSPMNVMQKYASDKLIESLESDFNSLFEEIKERHGKKCIIMSEVPIVSKTIHEAYTKGESGITSVNGVIDLLVIDEHGKCHIYDFKASKKSIGDWDQTNNQYIGENEWSTAKKQSAGYQLAFYASILRQWGLEVASTWIVPIRLDIKYKDDDIEIDHLTGLEIDFDNIRKFPNNSKHNRIAATVCPTETLLDNIDLISAVQEPMTKFFPNYAVELQIQANTVTVEQYLKNDKIVHRLAKGETGFGEYKWWVFTGDRKRFVKTEEELREVVTHLVNKRNSDRGIELETIATALTNHQDPSEVVSGSSNTKNYISRIFSKYVREDSSWEFQNNPAFIACGIFVFMNNVTKKLEVISLHNNEPHEEVNLGKGKSLLGATKADYEVDEHITFKATNGNIDLMKVMCVLNSLGGEVLNNFLVTKVASYNTWRQKGVEMFNDDLFANFSALCDTYGVNLNLNEYNFANPVITALSQIRDICGEDEYRHIGDFTLTLSPDNIIEGSNWILEKMDWIRNNSKKGDVLRKGFETGKFDVKDTYTKIYMLLGQALNKINGYNVYIERDPGMWLDGLSTGLMVNSPANAPSLNVQTIGKIFSVVETTVNNRALKYRSKIKKVLNDFYEYNKRSALWGEEVKYFDNLFRKDELGNIDKRMLLRNPNDPDLAPEEANLIRTFLQIFNELNGEKYTEEDIEYYELPLAKASRLTRRHKMGFVSEAKDYWSTQLNFMRLFPEQEKSNSETRARGEVYNKYRINPNARQLLIDNLDPSEFETNLESLFWDYVVSFEREAVMKDFLPKIQAVKLSLQYMNWMFGVKVENIDKWIDDFVKLNVYNEPIMDEKLLPHYRYAGVIRDIVGATSLGFNYRSGIREMVSGIWINLSRSMVNMYGHNHFNKSELIQAWTIICKDAVKNLNILTLVDALNVDYRMANADLSQLQEQLSYSKSGIKNLDSDALYIFSRIPDIYNRMGILVAQMIHDGCWEAHHVNENDELVYDFKKDKRFSLLNDPTANKNSDEYRKQRALYTAYREQFNKEGYKILDGEDLPRAYTILEGTSIKSFADMCFGHYDKSSQMLMKHKFFGAFYLQFKTFLSAKAEQWVLKPGTYNQGKFAEKFDSAGNRIVRIFTFDENDIPTVRYDVEQNVKPGDTWEPVMEWQGRFMEGMFYSVWDFGERLIKMDFKGFQELWKNDTKRANFKLFIHDMLWLYLISFIIQLLLGDNDETVWGHSFVTPVVQALGDGNAVSIMSSMFGDINPAMMTSVYKIWNNTTDMLTGDKTVSQALTGTFGSLSSLKYTIEEATE